MFLMSVERNCIYILIFCLNHWFVSAYKRQNLIFKFRFFFHFFCYFSFFWFFIKNSQKIFFTRPPFNSNFSARRRRSASIEKWANRMKKRHHQFQLGTRYDTISSTIWIKKMCISDGLFILVSFVYMLEKHTQTQASTMNLKQNIG